MPRCQIHTDTMIRGKPVKKGEVLDVSKETLGDLLMADKAHELKPGEEPPLPVFDPAKAKPKA